MSDFLKPVFLILLFALPALAQTGRTRDTNFNAWYMYSGDHKVSEKWGVHLEGQYRRNGLFSKPQQLLLRPAINFHLNESVSFTGGYAYVYSTPYGDNPVALSAPEHRIFQQVQVRQQAKSVVLTHRYRLEQRYLGETVRGEDGEIDVADWRYENRFRYLLRANIPLQGEMGKGKWYVGLYDELMLNFGENVSGNFFDQNRAYAALGYSLGKIGNLETGYLQQTVLRRGARVVEYNHTFQLALFSNFSFAGD